MGTILAFDTGPGNVLLNEWLLRHTGADCDRDGALAAQGTVDEAVLERLLAHPYFAAKPPKSLDRNDFTLEAVAHLDVADGAATLAAFTVQSILQAARWFPQPVERWVVAGGGRHNPTLLQPLKRGVNALQTAEEAGWEGDALEAQAFAFLAERSRRGLVLSLPSTTGVSRAVTGGAFYRAAGGGR